MTTKRKIAIKILFVFSIFALISVINEFGNVKLKEEKTEHFDNISFNSSIPNSKPTKVYEITENTTADMISTKICFDFKVHSIMGYNDLFQTAPGNDGIRLELSPPGTLGVLAGYLPDGFPRGYDLAQHLAINEWHKVEICIDAAKKTILIKLNNSEIINQENVKFNYKISEIAVGSGFSKTRNFDGEIKNFSIKYTLYSRHHKLLIMVITIQIFFFILSILLFFSIFIDYSKIIKKNYL